MYVCVKKWRTEYCTWTHTCNNVCRLNTTSVLALSFTGFKRQGNGFQGPSLSFKLFFFFFTFGVIIHPSQCSSEYIVAFPVTLRGSLHVQTQCEHVIFDAVVTCSGFRKIGAGALTFCRWALQTNSESSSTVRWRQVELDRAAARLCIDGTAAATVAGGKIHGDSLSKKSPNSRKKIDTLTSFSPRASRKVKLPSLTCRFLPKNLEKQLQSLKKRQRARRRTVHSNAPKRPKHVFFFFNNSKFGIYRKLVCQAFVQNIARRGPVIEVRTWRARSWLSNGLKLFKDSGSYHELHTKRWATTGTTLKYSAELFVHARAAVIHARAQSWAIFVAKDFGLANEQAV